MLIAHSAELEKFRVEVTDDLSADLVSVRPGNVIVAVRNPNRLHHLRKAQVRIAPQLPGLEHDLHDRVAI